jgi:hypothetical protein
MINGRLTLLQSIKNGTPTSKVLNLELVPLSVLFHKELKSLALTPLLLRLNDSNFWVSSEPT